MPESESVDWSPPDFADQRRTRIGTSVVEQFVRGHKPSDVLRELVQNEFDGDGDRLAVHFGDSALEVIGNGKGVTAEGWKRLSVIVGTGLVVGDDAGERVAPKINGIGSKNFGLRSLFLFGDEIYVRSGGQVCLLDLRTLETGKIADSEWWGGPGVRLQVPFRQDRFEMLEPFTAERELAAFDAMAAGMLATLVKLALPGSRKGIRELSLRSSRLQRALEWKQSAESLRSRIKGVSAVKRTGRLSDRQATSEERRAFEEIEFTKVVEAPVEHSRRAIAAYFKTRNGGIRIGVSLPVSRRRLDPGRPGYFHYPLQAPQATTGCMIGVSAPFEVDDDRSNLIEHPWNEWLIEQAAEFAVELLVGDWYDRFGASVFQALAPTQSANPTGFVDRITTKLKQEKCWPTRSTGSLRFALAAKTSFALDPHLEGFLDADETLDKGLIDSPPTRRLATSSGASEFTLSSLVRLRCAGEIGVGLRTKMQNHETNWHFTDYQETLRGVALQVKMASSLTALARKLTPAHKQDLRNTESTLSAAGALRPASELVVVPPGIWDVCPEPMDNRLHPALEPHTAISRLCRRFDEQKWMEDAAERAANGTIEIAERQSLYARILDEQTQLGRQVIRTLRRSPVVRDHRGEWAAPQDMVVLSGKLARFMAPVIHAPSNEMLKAKGLLAKLKVRENLNTRDLLAYAAGIADRPSTAAAFERLLSDNMRLLTPDARAELASIEFLRNKAGSLAAPDTLHLSTETNRTVVGRDEAIVLGTDEALYRRLGVAEYPSVDTLLDMLEELRADSKPPTGLDHLYPAIVAGLKREGRKRLELQDEPIVWWRGEYCRPNEILIGTHIPRILDIAVPVVRSADETTLAYAALGARTQPTDDDWQLFFNKVCEDWDGEKVPDHKRRLLIDAYQIRGRHALPPGIDDLACLLASDGLLYSLDELRNGLLVENDFPALARALAKSHVKLGVVDVVDKTQAFFHQLGIQPLSSIAGTGVPVLGSSIRPPNWFRPHYGENFIEMLRRPIFARALHAVLVRKRDLSDGVELISLPELAARLGKIESVTFREQICREYTVGEATVSIDVEVAATEGSISLVAPRTRLDFQQLLAQALAEAAGATNAALVRALATDFFPLVLCRSVEDIVVWLERIGLTPRNWPGDEQVADDSQDASISEELGEETIRQVLGSLDTASHHDTPPRSIRQPDIKSTPAATETASVSVAPPPLPDLATVELVVAAVTDKEVLPHQRQSFGGYGNGGWGPRSGLEVDRDREVGERGEELIYRMELNRLRKAGHPNPEDVVIWTSLADPGADHDICTIDDNGRPLWIEVKSTVGIDGRFEWSKKEFEKAMRERDRYQLWRVYRTGSTAPIAKCFHNPSKLLGLSRLQLDLGTFRASVEGAD